MAKEEFSKYERARIIGARGLQLAMDAPLLIDVSKEEMEDINHDSLRLAEKELEANVLPITVKRPLPEKKKEKLKEALAETVKTDISDAEKKRLEQEEEKEIAKKGDIMKLAEPEEEEVVVENSPETVGEEA